MESPHSNHNQNFNLIWYMIYTLKSSNIKKVNYPLSYILKKELNKLVKLNQMLLIYLINSYNVLFLCIKNLENKYEMNLAKCPDKNASLSFTMRIGSKQQIKIDTISEGTYKSTLTSGIMDKSGSSSTNNEYNFQKKGSLEEQASIFSGISTPSSFLSSKILKSDIMYKQSSGHQQKIKYLENENKKLKQDLINIKKEGQKFKKQVESSILQTQQWKNNTDEVKKLIDEMRIKIKSMKSLQKQNTNLQNEVLSCKNKLANIFNAAYQIGGAQLTDQLHEASGYLQKQ